ncbi:MAG: NAD-dependent epimerase/dehydratase family protein [Candidatus Nanohaloarchaea archaeon]
MEVAVTGGAGFLGSHLAEKLLERGNRVRVLDNLSSGKKENIPEEADFRNVDIVRDDLEDHLESVKAIFHFAANPSVQTFPKDRNADFEQNLQGTKKVLDAAADSGVEEIVFASSSVVYGENAQVPTPEEAKFDPISMYAATKCGCEHLARVYSDRFDIDLTILRYANIIGPRNHKGVVYDFVKKLEEDDRKLEILGNGRQRKSYLYVDEAVRATISAWKSGEKVLNIGSEDAISVTEIADIVSDVMGLDPEYSYTGGEKGWAGDVPEMRLDITRIEKLSGEIGRNSRESVRRTARTLSER